MKLFDCFMYNNENLILELRLNSLNDYVHKFVIVESGFDHQGNKKELKFNINKFKKFKHKIKYLRLSSFPKNLSDWDRENYNRNYLEKGISEAAPDDLIMISDVDEIPSIKDLNIFKKKKFTVFRQQMIYYRFNLQNVTEPHWYGTKVCKKKYLKSPQWLRNIKVKNQDKLFNKIFNNQQILKNGGWHFSSVKKPSEIITKMKSFAHSELVKDYMLNENYIIKKINNCEDIFERNIVIEKVELNNDFPDYLLKNKNKYNEFII